MDNRILCPNCLRPVTALGEHSWECPDCNIAGGADIPLNRPTTPLQDDFKEMVDDGQVKKIAGITINF
jgi:hypothetical protein